MPLNNVTRLCGAKSKRSGKPCKNPAVTYSKRCRMHGAHSWSGMAHPNFKHGFYSTNWLVVKMVNYYLQRYFAQVRKERLVSAYKAELEKLKQEKGGKLTVEEITETAERVQTEFQQNSTSGKRKKSESISLEKEVV